jgi:hypothetical protein
MRDGGVDDVVGLGGMDATPVGRVEVGWTSDFWRSRSWLLSIFFRAHNIRSHPEPPLHIVYASHHLAFQLQPIPALLQNPLSLQELQT